MKITIDAQDVRNIAEEIRRNCDLLSYTDSENAEDDICFYVPVIWSLADDLIRITDAQEEI